MNRRNFLFGIAGLTLSASLLAKPERFSGSHKPLIIYLSRSGNTQAVAKMIATATGGDLLAVKTKNAYPKNYQQTVEQVRKEDEEHFLPELDMDLSKIQHYQQIFIGFPTWGMQLPPPIRSLLAQVNWQGKQVIPFNTNAGYGVGSAFTEIRNTVQGANVLQGFSVKGGIERDGILLAIKDQRAKEVNLQVQSWLKNSHIL